MATHALGLFETPSEALAAAGELKGSGLGQPSVISPIPLETAEEVLGEKKSAIKRFTFFGAIFGCLGGFALAAGTAVLYLHPTGGRPIITWPPFLIITYEMTILCGILATVVGFLVSARFPAFSERIYVPEAAVDKFAVADVLRGPGRVRSKAEAILRGAGAEEVREVTA